MVFGEMRIVLKSVMVLFHDRIGLCIGLSLSENWRTVSHFVTVNTNICNFAVSKTGRF